MKQYIPLMSEEGRWIGLGEKKEVHEKGLLHRAFSILLFNKNKEMYLQKRAKEKYHSGGLWTNVCCSHPRNPRITMGELENRLIEEMGMKFDDNDVEHVFNFIYKKNFGNGLTEHELDSVYIGFSNQVPKPNTKEVDDWKKMNIHELSHSMKHHPEQYTFWFKRIFEHEAFGNWIRKNVDEDFYLLN